jgi:hypothetical protein
MTEKEIVESRHDTYYVDKQKEKDLLDKINGVASAIEQKAFKRATPRDLPDVSEYGPGAIIPCNNDERDDFADRVNRLSKDIYEHGKLADPVSHPAHYTSGKIEVIDFIEDQKFGYHLGQVIKYVARAGKKDVSKKLEDLRKAEWYLKRAISIINYDKG